MKLLFLNPEQYVDFENEPSNYQVRLPVLNSGLVSGYKDFVYQRSFKSSGRAVMNKDALIIFHKFKPDIVINSLCWWQECIDPQTLSVMRESGAKVISIYWDTWINALPHESEIFLNSDHILIMDSLSNYLKYRLLGEQHNKKNKVIFSPIAVFTDIIRSTKVDKDIDVLVIGSREGQRSELIDHLQRYYKDKDINFQHIGGLVNENESNNSNANGWVDWKIYANYINRSKICLSSQTQKDRIQIKGKVFDFFASKAFCLVDENTEIRAFIPDNCIAYFSDKDDCVSQINYYLKNNKMRIQIAESGYQWLIKNYNYKKFWRNLLNVIIGNESFLGQLPNVEDLYANFVQKQDLIIRLQISSINQLAQLISSGQTLTRLPVRAEGTYKGLNILNVDERYTIVCDQLDNDFIEINNQLYVISPDSGLVALTRQEIMLSPQIRTIRVTDIDQAKQTIDLINN